jgi:hypothetical protein
VYQVTETADPEEFDRPEDIGLELEDSAEMLITESGLDGMVFFVIDVPTLVTTFSSTDKTALEKLTQWDAPDIHFGDITEV